MISAKAQHLQEIERTQARIKTAKGFARKDLIKYLKRLQKELTIYNYYQKRG